MGINNKLYCQRYTILIKQSELFGQFDYKFGVLKNKL